MPDKFSENLGFVLRRLNGRFRAGGTLPIFQTEFIEELEADVETLLKRVSTLELEVQKIKRKPDESVPRGTR